jgi:parvulin-like peptidyl-prolyl isomerase
MLVDKKDPRIPEFDEVKTKVADAVKAQQAKDQLEQKAKEIASSVNSASELKPVAEKAGFEVGADTGYKLGATMGAAGTSAALDEAVYALKTGELTRNPVKVGDNWVIVAMNKRTDADLAEFASQRAQLSETLISDRKTQVFEDYIAAVETRMRQEGKIKIYPEVMAQLVEDEPAAAPRPRVPFPSQ